MLKYSEAIQINNKNYAAYNNRSLVYLKLKDYQNCILDSTIVIDNSSSNSSSNEGNGGINIKAFYRRGTAYQNLNKYKEAIADFKVFFFENIIII